MPDSALPSSPISVAPAAAADAPARPRVSCVICAYDEAPRLGAVLRVAVRHPQVDEVVVVDDGSTDGTAAVARSFGARTIVHPRNLGKSQALASGVAAARHELLLLLDADLRGLRAADLDALLSPVVRGEAAVAFSLRRNSLGVFRALGLDLVSGERACPRALLADALDEVRALPPFGVEVWMNERIVARRWPLAVVRWPRVSQVRKAAKRGAWPGLRAEASMLRDLLRVTGPARLLAQAGRLAALRVRAGRGAAAASA